MLVLAFEGWFECRLATDPDPSDEPRGVSGWTYAVAGERDLDRIIRTQPEEAVNRVEGPAVGVTVRRVDIDGAEIAGHPLHGAAVRLLQKPVFEGRNGLASEDTEEPVYPFHIEIAAPPLRLAREYRDLATGAWAFTMSLGVIGGPTITNATGIDDPPVFRARRRCALEARLASATTETERVAFEKRIEDIDRLAGGLPVSGLLIGLEYHYVLEGPWLVVEDPGDRLGGSIGESAWIASFWMGAWDTDALCGYMKGSLTLPFQRTT